MNVVNRADSVKSASIFNLECAGQTKDIERQGDRVKAGKPLSFHRVEGVGVGA